MNLFGIEHRACKQRFEGTHRTRPPGETVATWKPSMPRFGITRLADVTGLDHIGIPVVVAVRPMATSLATSQGKGLDLEAATASALMEAAELWHAENVAAPVRYATYDELRRHHRVIDVSRLQLVRERGQVTELPAHWIEGWDLLSEEPKWVPLECVALHLRPFATQFCRRHTSGLASGNHLLEALCHGLCEVIERDASTGARFGGQRRRVDLEAVRNPACRRVIDTLHTAGLTVIAWDITSDVGVATFYVRLVDRPEQDNLRPMFPGTGTGTHATPAVALLRALTEAVQDRLCRISGARDDITRAKYEKVLDQEAQRYLRDTIVCEPLACALDELPDDATDTFEGDARVLLEALRAAGIPEVVAVDLSRPDVGLPVLRIVAPALENAVIERTLPPDSRWSRRRSAEGMR